MSERPPKQTGYSWVSPGLNLSEPNKAIECYTQAFGFSAESVKKNGKGETIWGVLKYKDISIMISDQSAWGEAPKSPKTTGNPCPMSLYVYCEDVDAVHQKAVDYGLKVHQEPDNAFWGDRWCQIEDTEGYIWSFATNVSDFDPSKFPESS